MGERSLVAYVTVFLAENHMGQEELGGNLHTVILLTAQDRSLVATYTTFLAEKPRTGDWWATHTAFLLESSQGQGAWWASRLMVAESQT